MQIHIKLFKYQVLNTICHSPQWTKKNLWTTVLSPFWLYVLYPSSTGIICLLFSLLGPSKYCYFSTLQPLSCSTSFSFHWIKAKCVCLLAATGTQGMNYKHGIQTNQLHHNVYTTACRVKYTTHHLLPTTRDGLVYIKNECTIMPPGPLLLTLVQIQAALCPRGRTCATWSYLADLNLGQS